MSLITKKCVADLTFEICILLVSSEDKQVMF